MTARIRWQTPEEYECSLCRKAASGCIGVGHFGERTNAMPPDWRSGERATPRDSMHSTETVFACSQECADKLDQETRW